MEAVYLPERELLPRVLVARLYDTRAAGRASPTRTRTVEDYELSLYLDKGGAVTVGGVCRELGRIQKTLDRELQRTPLSDIF